MFRSIKVFFAAAVLAAFTHSSQAVAVIGTPPPGTYNFSGTCLDCSEEPSPAFATLVIGGGGEMSFSYASALYNLVSTWVEVASLGAIDGEGNADSNILFGTENSELGWTFTSSLAGTWELNDLANQTDNEDVGRNGVWRSSRVPEPATLALLALGVAAAARRRRPAVA